MNKYFTVLSHMLVTGAIILTSFAAALSAAPNNNFSEKGFTEDNRPFDFSDEFYKENGVSPTSIINRVNGADKLSVFDFTNDPRYRNVRIIGTFPAYDRDGNILYWNHYGDLYEDAFSETPNGTNPLEIANRYPIYVFPSETVKDSNRQAVIIENDEGYFEKNVLGLGVIVTVEFTDRIHTKEGQEVAKALAEKNGLSLDGTPIIREVKELNDLTRREFVRQTIRGANNKSHPPFKIAKIIDNLHKSAIAPDAFLLYVTRQDSNKPLPAEEYFVTNFECLQAESEFCSAK